MIVGTRELTNRIDEYAYKKLGIPLILLMENAGISFVKEIIKENEDKYLVIVGSGNNGGDGYVIARHLYLLNKEVTVYILDKNNMSEESNINYNIVKKLNISIIEPNHMIDDNILIEDFEYLLSKHNIIIDGIFGVGLDRNIDGFISKIINKINLKKDINVYSIDIPSGIYANTGNIANIAIKANKTISFVTYKKGFLNYNNKEYYGEIKIVDIGIKKEDIKKLANEIIIGREFIIKNKITRKEDTNKGDLGSALIIAGSEEFPGAAILTAEACVRSGAGYTKLLSRSNAIKESMAIKVPEIIYLDNSLFHEDITDYTDILFDIDITHTKYFNEQELKELDKIYKKIDAIGIGPGLKNDSVTLGLLRRALLNNFVVIDADALNVLEENIDLLNDLKHTAVLTPHPVEFSRISGYDIKEIIDNPSKCSKEFAKKYNIVLLLKGKDTIITDGDNIYHVLTGNNSMSNAGMGDTLTGIITSLIAQKYSPLNASIIASYLHGYIGDNLREDQYIVNASHIIDNIPKYLNELFTKEN